LRRLDFERLKTIPGLEKIVPLRNTEQRVILGDNRVNSAAIGTTPDLFDVINLHRARGEFFTQLQYDRAEAVCVLGAKAAKDLFPFEDPLTKTLQVGTAGQPVAILTVIGVLEPTGLRAGADSVGIMQRDIDQDIYFPLTLARHKWRRMLDVNVTGIVNCSAAARASMRERSGGVILNIASIAGFVATSSYGVSKLAVRGLTVALANELAADGIRVCCIAPGIVDSDAAMSDVPRAIIDEFIQQRQLIKRQGRVEDLVKAMLYLCSDDASFVTGETLIVGGGFPLRV